MNNGYARMHIDGGAAAWYSRGMGDPARWSYEMHASTRTAIEAHTKAIAAWIDVEAHVEVGANDAAVARMVERARERSIDAPMTIAQTEQIDAACRDAEVEHAIGIHALCIAYMVEAPFRPI